MLASLVSIDVVCKAKGMCLLLLLALTSSCAMLCAFVRVLIRCGMEPFDIDLAKVLTKSVMHR